MVSAEGILDWRKGFTAAGGFSFRLRLFGPYHGDRGGFGFVCGELRIGAMLVLNCAAPLA